MNIISYLKNKNIHFVECKDWHDVYGYEKSEMKEDIINYIYQLQQENNQLKERLKIIEEGYIATVDELCEYANIIDKAIKYCNSYSCCTGEDGDMYETDFCIDDLLEILKGDLKLN